MAPLRALGEHFSKGRRPERTVKNAMSGQPKS